MNQFEESKYFTWQDAWFFTALYMTHENGNPIDLTRIIAAGDALNHAIMTNEEIKTALLKLQTRGIVEIHEERIRFTELGDKIRTNAEKVKGGTFSRIDISLQKLNSRRLKLPIIKGVEINEKITEERIKDAYKAYIGKKNDN